MSDIIRNKSLVEWLIRPIFLISIVFIFLNNISFVQLYTSPTYLGWARNLTYIFIISFFLSLFLNNKIRKNRFNIEFIYILSLFVGMILHITFTDLSKPISDAIQWICLIMLVIIGNKIKKPKFLLYILLSFLAIHSLIAISENFNQTFYFDYSFLEDFEDFESSSEFRSFGLMQHPLFSANVTIIILAFILVSDNLNKYIRIGLIIIGTYSIFCFNSRAAMMIWFLLLAYRIFIYKKTSKWWVYLLVFGVIFFIGEIIQFIQQNSDIFGRLSSDTGLNDESSLTRFMSFVYFWNEQWSVKDIFVGGRILYLPGSDLSLENGILLTISWWGWVVGVIKVLLELIISYKCLVSYDTKSKLMILIATWGTAFANNNSFNTFVFVFFLFSLFAFESINKLSKKELVMKYVASFENRQLKMNSRKSK